MLTSTTAVARAGAEEPRPSAPAPPRTPSRRNPALDGLRGLAVLVVLVYHFAPDALPGGFLGVSTFFTLSGFLITNIIVGEWNQSGRVDTRHFWERRARRLLPAAVAGVVLAGVVTFVAGDGNQLRGIVGDAGAALGYVANWRFIASNDAYGATYLSQSPLLHYWSLAIEEQFYLLIGLVAWWFSRRGVTRTAWWLLAGGVAVVSLASTAWWATTSGLDRVYFGTDTRAFELAAGMLLALALGGRERGVVPRLGGRGPRAVALAAVSTAALVAFGWACATVDDRADVLRTGGFVVAAGVSTLLIVGCLGRGPVRRVLSFRGLTALGLISYGIYVYHWPLMTLLSPEHTGLHGAALFTVRSVATLAVALLSYRFLEQPVLKGRWRLRSPVARTAVAATAVMLTLGLVAMATFGPRLAAARDIAGDAPELADPIAAAQAVPPPAAPVPPPQRVLFLGDSLVHQALPTIADELAKAGMTTEAVGGPAQTFLTDDGAWLRELRGALDTFHPDVVVLEGCCGTDLRNSAGHALTSAWQDSADAALWIDRAREATQMALATGAAVQWILVPPSGTNGWYGYIEDRIQWLRGQYSQIAACSPGVGIVDWQGLANLDGSYAASLPAADGSSVQIRTDDGLHFTPAGQRLLAQMSLSSISSYWQARAAGDDDVASDECRDPAAAVVAPAVPPTTAAAPASPPG